MTRKPNAVPGGSPMPLDRAKRQATAIPGGTGANSAWLFRKDGRYEPAFGTEGNISEASGTSIFDPVLCELAYRWFCPPNGLVLDPFAGGSVRGIVANQLGYRYLGIDLSAAQVDANRAQAAAICHKKPAPVWHVGDAQDVDTIYTGAGADFLFTCPPYADLERYSDDPRDLSTMTYPDFQAAYHAILKKAAKRLAPDRFACIVIGDARGPDGNYYGLPAFTVQACQDAGLQLYNEAVLVTAVGSLPIRAGQQFQASRKLGKTHQNVLVFVKGSAQKATAAIGPVDFAEPDDAKETPNAVGMDANT